MFPGDGPVTEIGLHGGLPVPMATVGLQRLLEALRTFTPRVAPIERPAPGNYPQAGPFVPLRGTASPGFARYSRTNVTSMLTR